MRKLILPLLILFMVLHVNHAQSLLYAQEVVKHLASKELKGRGYVDKGERMASEYIAQEFQRLKVLPFGSSYDQSFYTSVNTFPSDMKVVVGKEELKAGEDYLVEAGSPSLRGKFQTVTLTVRDLLNPEHLSGKLHEARGRLFVIESFERKKLSQEELKIIDETVAFIKYSPDLLSEGTIQLTDSKLIWSGATYQHSRPSILIHPPEGELNFDQVEIHIRAKYHKRYQTQNVIGYLEGENPDSLIVFTAHYDHLGMMGAEAIFPGANDNASGIAMLLNLAKYFQKHQPNYTTVFMAFGGEELGLLGSKYFINHPLFDVKSIRFLINFDISGTGDDGIQVVNGSVYKSQFERLQSLNDEHQLLKQVKIRGESCNSDHCFFHQRGIPSFFIYTLGGIQAYHDIHDRSETLPLTAFENYLGLMIKFVNSW